MKIDVWLKRIWLVIGILVLTAFLIATVGFLIQYLSSTRDIGGPLVGTNAQPKGTDSLVGQSLSFDPPRSVGKTDWLFIGVHVRDLTAPLPASEMKIMKYQEYREPYQQSLVNVVFTKADGSHSYPLLDRKALIKSVDIPSVIDSLQLFHVYHIAFVDTDNDGRITNEDSSQLYVSDIAGHNLVPITSRDEVLQWYEKSQDGKQILLAVRQRPSIDNVPLVDWPERLYSYDVKAQKRSRFPADEQTFDRIRRQLWGK
jgi:hypothetical protein